MTADLIAQSNRRRYHEICDKNNDNDEFFRKHENDLNYIWGQIFGYGQSIYNYDTQCHVAGMLCDLEKKCA